MSMTLKTFVLALAALCLAPMAAAHTTQYYPVGCTQPTAANPGTCQLKFVYGSLYEPVSTFQKTGLDLTVSERVRWDPTLNAGAGGVAATVVPGLEALDSHTGQIKANPPLHATLLYAGKALDMTSGLVGQFGAPGKYTYPLILTQPGTYKLHLVGTVNGTAVDTTIDPPHDIEDASALMFPTKVPGALEQSANITKLQSDLAATMAALATAQADIAALKQGQATKASPLNGADLMLAILGVLAFAAVRRNRSA